MDPIIINSSLCRADELCVKECPVGVLKMQTKGEAPVVRKRKAQFCINCGHCAAICPTNAITLTKFENSVATPISVTPNYEEFENLIKSRRSIRKFKDKPIERETIEELLELTQYTPSGHNAQATSWTVLDTADKVQDLAKVVLDWMQSLVDAENPIAKKYHMGGMISAYKKGVDVICRNAPMAAFSWAPKAGVTPAADAILATGYLELGLHAKNLGGCWAGYVVMAAQFSPEVRAFLNVPEDCDLHGGLLMGYKKTKYRNHPPRLKMQAQETENGLVYPASN